MKQNRKYGIAVKLVFAGLISITGLIFYGCENGQADLPDLPQVAKPGENASQEEVLLYEIVTAEDFFQWHVCREKYQELGITDETIESAISAKELWLRKAKAAQPLGDSLELVDFKWEMQGEDPGDGQEASFKVSWLFYKKELIQTDGQVVYLVLRGKVDKHHSKYLKVKPYGENMIEKTWRLEPPLDEWPTNEYRLITQTTKTPSIPYEMLTWLIWDPPTGSKRGYIGEQIKLGWHVDLGK